MDHLHSSVTGVQADLDFSDPEREEVVGIIYGRFDLFGSRQVHFKLSRHQRHISTVAVFLQLGKTRLH